MVHWPRAGQARAGNWTLISSTPSPRVKGVHLLLATQFLTRECRPCECCTAYDKGDSDEEVCLELLHGRSP